MALASAERGALLWVPAMLLATSVALFAARVAPSGVSLFTHTTSLRIAIGPCTGEGTTPAERAAFVSALRRSLASRGDVSVVDSMKVARMLGSGATVDSGLATAEYLRALRPLGPHLALQAELRRTHGLLGARVEAWDLHEPRSVLEVRAQANAPDALGHAVACSLGSAFSEPRHAPAGRRDSGRELRSASTSR